MIFIHTVLVSDRPVVKRGLEGGSWTTSGKEAEAGEDWARDRGRCPARLMERPAASMDAW